MKWIFILLIFTVSCNRIEMDYYSLQESKSSLDPIAALDSQGRRKDILLTRSHPTKFQERFISSKLDMVFILDTNKKTESFYSKKNSGYDFLGYDFLNYFYDYDWRLAWTDMSVDIESLKGETKKESNSDCNFFSNLIMTVGGVFADSVKVTSFGLKGLFNCISHIDLISQKKNTYANGSFLPFESNQKTYYLNKSNQYSSSILSNSLLLPNPKQKPYKAPLLKETQSFPFLSMIFSMSKNLYTPNNSSFFRKDSLVVFVLFSLEDGQISLSSENFKESLASAFGSHDRFKLIFVTLKDSSNVFCPLKYKSHSLPKKLIQFAEGLNQPVLDICSQNLGKNIFKEISKGLSSQKLL